MYVMDRFFVPFSDEPVICDHTLYTLQSKVKNIELYLNSTLFYVTMELFLRRLGGGGGVGEIMVADYEQISVPNLENMDLTSFHVPLSRNVGRYFEEVTLEDRRRIDLAILHMLSIDDFPVDQLYKEFVELVDDRLVKADRPLKREEANEGKEEESEEESEEDD